MTGTHTQFVNICNPADIKTSSIQLSVRSHVARYQWQNHKKHARKKNVRQQFLPVRIELCLPDSQDDINSTYTSTSHDRPLLAPQIPRLVGGCRVDPFQSYPIWRPFFPLLVDHYLVSMAVDIPELDEPTQPGLLRTRWFPLAISDRALFLVIILLAASHYVACYQRNDLRLDLLQLRYEAIRSINLALQVETDHQNMPSDATIGAVAKMASYEAMFGSLGGYNTHMHGLMQMIALRGGLGLLGLNGLLRRMVIWIDRNAAFLHGLDEVYFPHDELSTPNPAHFLGAS